MSVYFSSAAFANCSLEQMADECAQLNVGLEFTSNFSRADDLVSRMLALRGARLLVHNYFPPPREPFVLNLAATRAEIREASHALCRAAIELSAQIGAPFYSVHSGFAMNLTADQLGQPEQQAALAHERLIDRAEAERAFRESVIELSQFARERGVALLLENNVITRQQIAAGRAGSLLMTTPDECRDFLDELDDSNVGLLLDVAHAKVAANALDFSAADFFKLGSRIRALHLSDNDGARDNNQPFARDAWFAPHVRERRELPVVVEVYRLNDEDRIRQRDVLFSMIR